MPVMSVGADDGRVEMMDRDILQFVGEQDRPVSTSMDVAAEFDVTQAAAYQRLQKLHEQGLLGKYKVGSRAVVWWVCEENPGAELPSARR
jgi:predicted ArsR family transcriptional regulator